MTRFLIALACAALIAAASGSARAQSLCDVNGDGQTTDVDVVNVLRSIAALSSSCTLASCDVNDDGTINGTDRAQILLAAADLPSLCTSLGDVIVLTPSNVTLTVGESRFYTAIAPAEGGGTVNVTQEVTYTSSNPAVAQAPNLPGTKSEVIAVSPGVVTISAEDPMTGLSSTPGGDATLTVLGVLESIALTPESTTLTIGESRFYTAVGHFAGGDTLNLTQEVEYASSDDAVAEALNEPGLRSKITAVGSGDVTITARDPETNVVSNAAALRVLGDLESLALVPESATRAVGNSIFYTVNGTYAGGFVLNLTQEVEYASSNEAVAVALNEPGLRSRIDPVGVGETMISARDVETGVTSNLGILTVGP